MRVAIQGSSGSFHHQAAKAWFGEDVTIVPSETFTKAFLRLENNEADTALLAIENSIHGPLTETLDLIESYHYPIIGEIYLRIHQQLIGLPGTNLEQIKYVYSQPVALAQCSNYLAANLPSALPVDYHDTTASVEHVKTQGDPTIAAVAGIDAAKEHGLEVIAENIEDNKENFTRFLIIDPSGKAPHDANKSSIVLTTTHLAGSLAQVLIIFAHANINLTKLQSRPIVGDAWKYRFHIDLETAGPTLQKLLADVRETGATVTVLGEYASGKTY